MSGNADQFMQLRSHCDGSCSSNDLAEVSLTRRVSHQHHHHVHREETIISQQNSMETQHRNGWSFASPRVLVENYETTYSDAYLQATQSASSQFRANVTLKGDEFANVSLYKGNSQSRWSEARSPVQVEGYGLDDDSEEDQTWVCNSNANAENHSVQRVNFLHSFWRKTLAFMYLSALSLVKFLYKLSTYALLIDVYLLSRAGRFRSFVHRHFKSLFFGILLIGLSSYLYQQTPNVNFEDFSVFGLLNSFSSNHQRESPFTAEELRPTFDDEQLKIKLQQMLKDEELQFNKKESTKEANDEKMKWMEVFTRLEMKVKYLEEENAKLWSHVRTKTQDEASLKLLIIQTLNILWDSNENVDEATAKLVLKLKNFFVSKEEFLKLFSSTYDLQQLVNVLKEKVEKSQVPDAALYNQSSNFALSNEEIIKLIRKELALYDADKLGLTDYALETGGGSVINTRCSETYSRHSSQLIMFGIPLWHIVNSPRTVIQPGRNPGECWPFVGSEGYVVIQLARRIIPTAFSIDHIPKAISPNSNINTAPKDFSVWGLENEKDSEGLELGRYRFEDNDQPLQTFPVLVSNVKEYSFIELRIHSNHGNPEFTCLYRFRVHGTPTEVY